MIYFHTGIPIFASLCRPLSCASVTAAGLVMNPFLLVKFEIVFEVSCNHCLREFTSAYTPTLNKHYMTGGCPVEARTDFQNIPSLTRFLPSVTSLRGMRTYSVCH